MKNTAVFFFSILIASAFGCKQQINDQNSQTIDSLITLVDADILSIEKLDFDKVKSITPEVDAYMNFFAGEYENLDNQAFYLNQLSDLANCQKYSGRLLSKYEGWLPKLKENKKQLEDLAHDYKNGIIKSQDFEVALGNEAKITIEKHKDVEKNMNGINHCLDIYSKLSASLDSARVDFLNSKND